MNNKNNSQTLLKYYLLALLPFKVFLAQTVVMGTYLGIPNPSQLLNIYVTIINIILIIFNLRKLIYDIYIYPLFMSILTLSFCTLILPIFSFYFSHRINDFSWFLKILSWILILPLSFIAFRSKYDIVLLRKSAIIAFFIIIFGILIGNIFKLNRTAYGLGIFHMGFWDTEAPLSVAILSFCPFIFLSKDISISKKVLNKSSLVLLLLNFLLLCLVMKRSSIVAFIISVIIILFLLAKCREVPFNLKQFFLISGTISLFIIVIFAFIFLTNPKAVEKRFTKDFQRAEERDDITLLGSGRIGLATETIKIFMRRPLLHKLIGIDIAGSIDKRKKGYIYTELKKPPHNDYLDMLMRCGLIGVFIYISFLIISFSMVIKIYLFHTEYISVYTSAITLGMYTSYFICSFSGALQQVILMTCFMMLIGATLGISCESKNKIDKVL